MTEGRKKDRTLSQLSFHTLSEDTRETDTRRPTWYTDTTTTTTTTTTTHSTERLPRARRNKATRSKKAHKRGNVSGSSGGSNSSGNSAAFITTNSFLQKRSSEETPLTKALQRVLLENRLEYEILVPTAPGTTTTSSERCSGSGSCSTVTTPECALSYAAVFCGRPSRQLPSEGDIPQLVYEKDISPIAKSSTNTTTANPIIITSQKAPLNSSAAIASNQNKLAMTSEQSSFSAVTSRSELKKLTMPVPPLPVTDDDDAEGLFEDFYENDNTVFPVPGRGLDHSILGELEAFQGLHYPLRGVGFGGSNSNSSSSNNNSNNGNNSGNAASQGMIRGVSIGGGMTSSSTSSQMSVGNGAGLNDVYGKALNAILMNEFDIVDENGDFSNDFARTVGDDDYMLYGDDYDSINEWMRGDYDDDYDDDDNDDDRFDLLDNGYDDDDDENSEDSKDNENAKNNITDKEKTKIKTITTKEKKKKKKRKEVQSFYYERAGHDLLEEEEEEEEEEENSKEGLLHSTLLFTQKAPGGPPLPLVPDLTQGSDSETDEEASFVFSAIDEIEESAFVLKRLKEVERAKRTSTDSLQVPYITKGSSSSSSPATAKDTKKTPNETEPSEQENSLLTSENSLSSSSDKSSQQIITQKGQLSSLSQQQQQKLELSSSSLTSSLSVPTGIASLTSSPQLGQDGKGEKEEKKKGKKSGKALAKAKKYDMTKRCGSLLCKQNTIQETNDNYLELRCSAGCRFYLHPKCSKKLDAIRKVEDTSQPILDKFSIQCPTPDCWGTLTRKKKKKRQTKTLNKKKTLIYYY